MVDKMKRRKVNDNEARALGRNLRVSPFKLNLVAGTIRGKSCAAAVNELTFSKKRIAADVKKVVLSAIANAENNHGLDIDSLVISKVLVGKGMVLKRMMPRAKGRGDRITKPFSHILVEVREVKESK